MENANDFFREYAAALLVWQHVEEALFKFTFMFFPNEDLKRVGAIYYGQESFSAKLRIANVVASVELSDLEKVEWSKLVEKKIKPLASERNVLAHTTAVADLASMQGMMDEIQLVLGAPIFAPQEIRREKKRKYNAEGASNSPTSSRISHTTSTTSRKSAAPHDGRSLRSNWWREHAAARWCGNT